MAVAFVSIGADSNAAGTVAIPAGSAGDFLTAFWESDTLADAAAASGWTAVRGTYAGARSFGYLYKFDAGTGGGNQAFTGLNDSPFDILYMTRYSGVDTTTPINVSALETGSNTTVSLTTTVANCMEIASFSFDAGIGSTAAPAGFTRRHDGNGGNFYMAERLKVASGATGTTAFTGPGAPCGLVHIALAPVSAATGKSPPFRSRGRQPNLMRRMG